MRLVFEIACVVSVCAGVYLALGLPATLMVAGSAGILGSYLWGE